MLAAAGVAAALAWLPLPPAGQPRSEVGAARVGASLYVVGGFGPGGRTTNTGMALAGRHSETASSPPRAESYRASRSLLRSSS
jgi:hypothetical protein